MKFSRSDKRITQLEKEVIAQRDLLRVVRRQLNEAQNGLNNTTQYLIETRKFLLDYINSPGPISSRMSSSNAGTGSGPGDITPTSDDSPSIVGDIYSAMLAGANSPSRETGVHEVHGCGTKCWCGYDDTDHHVRAYHERAHREMMDAAQQMQERAQKHDS